MKFPTPQRLLTALLLTASIFTSYAQTTREEVMADPDKSGGVYLAYPVTEAISTPAPKGYIPVHISHYGRHGSRYLISDNDYEWVIKLLQKAKEADALTPLGEDVLVRLDSIMVEARGRGGDLSPLGVRQHKGIAHRMIRNYPEVFADSAAIKARSTVVIRCILSMAAFCEELTACNPKLQISRDASERDMYYMNYHSPESNAFTSGDWKIYHDKFKNAHTHPDRLMEILFKDKDFVKDYVVPDDLMWGLYWIASDMQDIETPVSFYDLFTPEELFDLWQTNNYAIYVRDSSYPGSKGLVVDNAKNLLRNVIETADASLRGEGPAAALRFGHDGNIIPFAALLQLEDCYGETEYFDDIYKVFADFKVSPMAANIQIVFFAKKKDLKNGRCINPDDVLVKFLHNEKEVHIPLHTDTWPFYPWPEVRSFYEKILNEQ